jgi:hypothetical protein
MSWWVTLPQGELKERVSAETWTRAGDGGDVTRRTPVVVMRAMVFFLPWWYGLRMRHLSRIVLILLAGCGGTHLEAIDVRAETNQQAAAAAIETRAQTQCQDPGGIQSLAESIWCSAGGTLQRAGQPAVEGGVPCPKQ